MSTSNIQNVNTNGEKFTRGEKCIFIHLVLTFVFTLIVVLTYLIHLYAVDHTPYNVFKTRRSLESTTNIQIGMAYLKLESPVAICNTILFRSSWSIAPGHCVAMRSEPDMKYAYLQWHIKYTPENSDKYDLKILRTMVHPHFVRYSLAHNIGLFQHDPVTGREIIPTALRQPVSDNKYDRMAIGTVNTVSASEAHTYYPINVMEPTHCSEFTSFIENIREYEFCGTFVEKHYAAIEHGAIVMKDNKIAGMFSWGDKNGKVLPFVIINITFYKRWIRQQSYLNLENDENSLSNIY